jgi:lipid-binding SYLF domain-containing protein
MAKHGKNMKPILKTAVLLAAILSLAFPSSSHAFLFFGPRGNDAAQKRATIRQQSSQMIAQLVATNPQLQSAISNAVGYATFSLININLLLLSTSNGYGIVVNNRTGKQTFMRMASLGYGIGAGLQDLRVIFIFTDANVMNTFVNQGWQFGGQADAAATYQNKGVSAQQSVDAAVNYEDGAIAVGSSSGAAANSNSTNSSAGNFATPGGMQIYQVTESGISLQATVAGTKYWKDSGLNQ